MVHDLRPFLRLEPGGPKFHEYLNAVDKTPRRTVLFLVDLNRQLQKDIGYLIRMEPGVQTPEETLSKASGSCRDSSWLLVQLCRHLGIAARFVSGYLVQLTSDIKSLDGPSGPENDFTDLHAWVEVYLPGAGWVGLDPTSGLFAGEGHIPLACTPHPMTAAPISGGVEECEDGFPVRDVGQTLPRRSSRHQTLHRGAMGEDPRGRQGGGRAVDRGRCPADDGRRTHVCFH